MSKTLTTKPAPQPPRPLGVHGMKLWNRVQLENTIRDVGGLECLAQACVTLDRAEELAECIAKDGPVIRTKNGLVKAHPSIKDELGCRAFVTRTLTRLGLTVERVRPPGRPTHAAIGVTWRQIEKKPWEDEMATHDED
jgi:hypothetical protein